MTTEPRYVTDFGGILDQLRRQGFTMTAIERETEIPRTTLIEYLINGTAPSHSNGERLIAFFCQVTSTARESLPTRRWLPSVAQSMR
jgi:lambda repressor-like predicted transcriptional regulator